MMWHACSSWVWVRCLQRHCQRHQSQSHTHGNNSIVGQVRERKSVAKITLNESSEWQRVYCMNRMPSFLYKINWKSFPLDKFSSAHCNKWIQHLLETRLHASWFWERFFSARGSRTSANTYPWLILMAAISLERRKMRADHNQWFLKPIERRLHNFLRLMHREHVMDWREERL